MNQRSAKALRRVMGFDPHAPRTYNHEKPSMHVMPSPEGPKTFAVTGTITATGKRRQYKAVKRADMVKHVMGSAH